MDTTCIII